ncbi:SRPBCC family protein [Psychroserpens luteolus]|uniref:SRPBCC family protein n=1 Tax=Psychroserpens luteolus TaxID=2855840 RepID=UPI001E3A27D8|nr:SRPBCC domain-containing protein [Psychroserpens luteolus]MCD2257869.1 SRPBCC domain-containing protein [Psychroserpens luteolus]
MLNNKPVNYVDTDYHKQIDISASPKEAFKALTDHIHLWWSRTSDSVQKEGGHFTIHFENGYWWTFKILEFTPNNEIIWKCIDGEPDFNKEWIGHVLHWKITEANSKTIINFHQVGLTPDINCYEVCSTTWDMFITERLKDHLS